MTRRVAERHPRRLSRMRPALDRPEHAVDVALFRPLEDGSAHAIDTRALRALAEENAMLARELGRVQARCTQWRDDCIAQAHRLEALLMRTRGELLAKQTALAIATDALDALQAEAADAGVALHHRRVLCVGGRARQVPVYRQLVERAGGRFTHVDGSSPDALPALRRALADADLVILQPAYATQGTCKAVESHCDRHGIRCVQLDKTCVPGFLASLAQA